MQVSCSIHDPDKLKSSATATFSIAQMNSTPAAPAKTPATPIFWYPFTAAAELSVTAAALVVELDTPPLV